MSYPTVSPTKIARSAASLPDPSLPAPEVGHEDRGFTAQDLIDKQATLERHAREAIPFASTECTWGMGYIRQPVYACKTCGGGGVCAGCSVGCHAEHDLVELFNRRNFRCDCGTPSLCRTKLAQDPDAHPPPCNLRNPPFDPENEENTYSHNFDGAFCRCERGKVYDPEAEEETMFQCIACEDWFHEGCTSLLPGGAVAQASQSSAESEEKKSITEPPPPLFDHERFEHVLCNACVRADGNDIIRRYVGAEGWATILPAEIAAVSPTGKTPFEYDDLPVVRATTIIDAEEQTFVILGLSALPAPTNDAAGQGTSTLDLQTQEPPASSGVPANESGTSSQKRPSDESVEEAERSAKRARTLADGVAEGLLSTSIPAAANQSAVPQNKCSLPVGHSVFLTASKQSSALRLDAYLSENFRDRICRCESCLPLLQKWPYLLGPEVTYSPPHSLSPSEASGDGGAGSTAGSSTYDLGLEALKRLPREKAIESLRAYEKMRDALWGHLRPFAASGEPVDEASIREFFDKQRGAE